MNKNEIRRGDVWFARIPDSTGYEIKEDRPVIVLQNNKACRYSPLFTVIPTSEKIKKPNLPCHLPINPPYVLAPSQILVEQIMTIDKSRFINKIGRINRDMQKDINQAVIMQLGLDLS